MPAIRGLVAIRLPVSGRDTEVSIPGPVVPEGSCKPGGCQPRRIPAQLFPASGCLSGLDRPGRIREDPTCLHPYIFREGQRCPYDDRVSFLQEQPLVPAHSVAPPQTGFSQLMQTTPSPPDPVRMDPVVIQPQFRGSRTSWSVPPRTRAGSAAPVL